MKRGQLVRKPRFGHGLGFNPQDQVRWLSPRELARAGIKAVLSAVFADYADKREIQSNFDKQLITIPDAPPDTTGDCWFDYVSDLGDGFDATYTIASLLAEESLTPHGSEGPLPRGSMLVLGGDEVYPTASAEAYEDRMTGPYRAAFPYAEKSPLLIALPGNHDWYDGLTSFLRAFTTGRSIGGWKTVQTRSYFAVQLPHRWWLVGLDSQFESYIDEPQLKYFEETFTRHLQPGDGVILCSASPTWLKTTHDPDAFNPLFWFEKHYIRSKPVPGSDRREPTGAEVRLWLTGDLHHYARYVEDLDVQDPAETDARQMVTCGLGGAFLSATHNLLPGFRVLPELSRSYREGDAYSSFLRAETTYPDAKTSKSMAKDLAKPWKHDRFLLWRNPGLGSLIAAIHTLLFLGLFLMLGQGRTPATSEHGRVVAAYLTAGTPALWVFAGTVLATVVAIVALVYLAPLTRGKPPFLSLGSIAAGLAQVGVLLGSFLTLAYLLRTEEITSVDIAGWHDIAILLLVSVWAAVVGGFVGGLVFAVSIVCFRTGGPLTWQLSGQAIEDYKGFLRIRLSADGLLTVFPMVVDQINRDWVLRPFQAPTDSMGQAGPSIKVPRAAEQLPTPRLLEEPFSIARTASRRKP